MRYARQEGCKSGANKTAEARAHDIDAMGAMTRLHSAPQRETDDVSTALIIGERHSVGAERLAPDVAAYGAVDAQKPRFLLLEA
jgi:hypothetical protein